MLVIVSDSDRCGGRSLDDPALCASLVGMRKGPFVALIFGITGVAVPTPHSDAAACGLFAGPRGEPERRPSLAYEQALIVYDEAKHRQHFIREIVFRGSDERFGFVVPTPSLPEVAKVAKSPFQELRSKFPFNAAETLGGGLGLSGVGGFGHGKGAGGSVTVLDTKKVGSFTAFVLAADDAAALTKWLNDNDLATTPETEPWLAHYVRSKFTFVAMRYDPPAKKPVGVSTAKSNPTRMQAEVVRISFDTPRPYYPYFEPDKPLRADEPRMLEIWLATQAGLSQPLAVRAQKGVTQWLRPFAEGKRYDAEARADLASAMGGDARLLPAGQLVLQRFMDQKKRRSGWGDVVFVPEKRAPLDRATDAELDPLAAVLDPRLLPAETK